MSAPTVAPFTPVDEPLDVRIVVRGTVHRHACPKVPDSAVAHGWRPAMAGLDDRPCLYCLPDMGGHQ